MAKVWVTGASGLIGSHIVAALRGSGGNFIPVPLTRAQFDLEDAAALQAAFAQDEPDAIVHCAAYSDTSFCEAHPERAFAVNVAVSLKLAELARDRQFILFSTDLVFDGCLGDYSETAPVRPLSVYARSKLAAEEGVLANSGHAVLRTSLTAGPSPRGNKGFDESLVNAWRAGRKVTLFVDEYRTPIAAAVTARAVCEFLQKKLTGLFHLAGAERLSRYEIGALLAARHVDLRPQIARGSLRECESQQRPADCSLNCEKIQRELSFELPAFSTWMQQMYQP